MKDREKDTTIEIATVERQNYEEEQKQQAVVVYVFS
jgi:hypothetical protein